MGGGGMKINWPNQPNVQNIFGNKNMEADDDLYS